MTWSPAASAGKRLTDWCRINWTVLAALARIPANRATGMGRRTLRKFNGSSRRIGATALIDAEAAR